MLKKISIHPLAFEFASAFLLSLYFHKNILIGGISTNLTDVFDQRSFIWILEWLHHSVFGAGKITDIISPNIFYPNKQVLAWSDMLLGFIPFYSTARIFTQNPLLAFNLTAFSLTFLSCLGMMRLGRLFTGQFSIIAPLIASIGLITAGQESHLQMKSIALSIWFLVCLIHYLQRQKPWQLTLAIVLFCWQFHTSVYLTIIFFYFFAFLLLLLALLNPRPVTLFFLKALGDLIKPFPLVITGLSLFSCCLVMNFYLGAMSVQGLFSKSEAVTYSARFLSLLDAPHTSFLYTPIFNEWGSHEAKLMAGMVTYGLLIICAMLPKSPTELNIFNRNLCRYLWIFAFISILFAFGPYEKESFNKGIKIPLPGIFAWHFLPGFSVLRTVGRFGLVAVIFLGLLSEIGFQRILSLSKLKKWKLKILSALFIIIVGIDQHTSREIYPVKLVANKPFYERVNDTIPTDAVLLELPLTRGDHLETMSWFLDQELASTLHWRKLVVGYSSKFSPEIHKFMALWNEFVINQTKLAAFMEYAKNTGVSHVIVDSALVTSEQYSALKAYLANEKMILREDTKEIWALK